MSKQPHVTEVTRQAFINAFCELAKTGPIEKITTQALANRAGHNRCTFYTYFNNLQNLMEHIEDEVISYVVSNVLESIENVDAPERFIALFSEDVKELQTKYIDVLLANPQQTTFIVRLKDALLPAFMKRFNISDNDRKSRYVLDFHISGMISVASQWLSCGRDLPTEQLGEIVRGVLTKGVLKTLAK